MVSLSVAHLWMALNSPRFATLALVLQRPLRCARSKLVPGPAWLDEAVRPRHRPCLHFANILLRVGLLVLRQCKYNAGRRCTGLQDDVGMCESACTVCTNVKYSGCTSRVYILSRKFRKQVMRCLGDQPHA